jgi:hypothetical protein
MSTIDYTETLAITHCWCGIAVAIPENLMTYARRHKGKAVYCPLGHEFVYGNSVEEQLADEKRRHRATRDLLEAEEAARRSEERSHAQTRGQLRKTRERAKVGVCPVCHRTISQMARHMASKHPDFDPADVTHDHEHEHEEHQRKQSATNTTAVIAFLKDGPKPLAAIREKLDLEAAYAGNLMARMLKRGEVVRLSYGVYGLPA